MAKAKSARSIPLAGQGISKGSTIDMPTGGGRPRRGSVYRPPKIAEAGPREVREGLSRRTEERIIASRSGETARRVTIRERNRQQQATFQAREEQIRQSASFRKSLQTGSKSEAPSAVSGIVRILIIVIVLSLLLLVLKNPGAGVASAGATGGFLNHFLTANPQPLFKAKSA